MIIKEWKNKKVIVGNEEKEKKMRKMSLITYREEQCRRKEI